MSLSLLEVLQNADYNLQNAFHPMQLESGKRQLHNAVVLLDKGYNLGETFEDIMGQYEEVEDVPERT
jgi:hypothetical protein